MDDLNFCPACGKDLPPGTAYCPMCGARLNDIGAPRSQAPADVKKNGERVKIAAVLLIITAVISITSGIYLYLHAADFVDSLVNMFPAGTFSAEMINSLEGTLQVSGLLSVIGGMVAVITAALALKRRMYTFTIILCIVATLLGNFIIGLIALYLIHKAKPAFTD